MDNQLNIGYWPYQLENQIIGTGKNSADFRCIHMHLKDFTITLAGA